MSSAFAANRLHRPGECRIHHGAADECRIHHTLVWLRARRTPTSVEPQHATSAVQPLRHTPDESSRISVDRRGAAVHDAVTVRLQQQMTRGRRVQVRGREVVLDAVDLEDGAKLAPQEVGDEPDARRQVDTCVLLERRNLRTAQQGGGARLGSRPRVLVHLVDRATQVRTATSWTLGQLDGQFVRLAALPPNDLSDQRAHVIEASELTSKVGDSARRGRTGGAGC
jgi:hypothetical protein